MIISSPPTLPFPSFKWRWASVAPTEGLNDPKVYLGILRAFYKCEGESPSSDVLLNELAKIKQETGTIIDLVRTKERNLIRNSGQYWKALGLLEKSVPVIALTPFGRNVATSNITMAEFAATTIATLELPNLKIQDDYATWAKFHIKFKPLELLLAILSRLSDHGLNHRYITKFELIKIIIPISIISNDVNDFVDTLLAYRAGGLSLDGWPNCAPNANDHRMATEFLLFLTHYGYCRRVEASTHLYDKYFLEDIDNLALKTILTTALPIDLNQAAKVVSKSGVADFVERQRVLREVLSRPNQPKFRKNVLEYSGCECVITGTQLNAALEAAHIIPVKENGSDNTDNGFCMRSDVHTLFDNGHIRIAPNGKLHLSDSARSDPVYKLLPLNIVIPQYVKSENVQWRWNYL